MTPVAPGDVATLSGLRAPAWARSGFLAAREATAFLRLATLLPLDLLPVVPAAAPGEDVAVLVHGALATAGAFRPLRRRLEATGVRTASFTYGPAAGVRDVAARLSELLRRLPAGACVHLVGHSLGGLGVRWFVQEHPRDPRVARTISVGTPFLGTRAAALLPFSPGRDMRPGSDVLARLAARAAVAGVPHLSILGGADAAVPLDTTFPVGERAVVPDVGHNRLLFDDAVAARIAGEIRLPR